MVMQSQAAESRRVKGFTLIEVLVVLSIIATLLTLVAPRYFEIVARSKETTLKHDLIGMRDAIDKYYSDTGNYPDALDDLVAKKYLRAIPEDPITGSDKTWVITPPDSTEVSGSVYDMHSGSPAIAQDGSNYAEW